VPDRYPQTLAPNDAVPSWRPLFLLLLWNDDALAHAIAEGDKGYIRKSGVHLFPVFMYLGASTWRRDTPNPVLLGVIFSCTEGKHFALYVTHVRRRALDDDAARCVLPISHH